MATLEIGKSVLQAFAILAGKYIEKAREYKEHDIRACENYLEAVSIAITGLEAEVEQILLQAKQCDLSQPDQIKALKVRTRRYLHVDILRPKLQHAVMGLVLCQGALKKSAEGFFLWFWPPLRENRQEAKDEFDKLLQKLQNYLNELDVGWGSGVYAEKLRDIENYLAELPKGNIEPDGLVRRISEFQRDPSKYDLIINIGRIRETAHHVRNAFSASRKP